MTNEEALRILHCPSAYLTDEDSEFAHMIPLFSKAYGQAMVVAFEALKQADALDKIRAEIEEYKSRQLTLAIGVDDLEKGKQIALEYVLEIIDMYKAESEG